MVVEIIILVKQAKFMTVLFKHLWCSATVPLNELCSAAGYMSSLILLMSCTTGKRAAHFKFIVLHGIRRAIRPGSAVEPLVEITGKMLNLGAVAEKHAQILCALDVGFGQLVGTDQHGGGLAAAHATRQIAQAGQPALRNTGFGPGGFALHHQGTVVMNHHQVDFVGGLQLGSLYLEVVVPAAVYFGFFGLERNKFFQPAAGTVAGSLFSHELNLLLRLTILQQPVVLELAEVFQLGFFCALEVKPLNQQFVCRPAAFEFVCGLAGGAIERANCMPEAMRRAGHCIDRTS